MSTLSICGKPVDATSLLSIQFASDGLISFLTSICDKLNKINDKTESLQNEMETQNILFQEFKKEQIKFNCDIKDKYNILDDIKTQINEIETQNTLFHEFKKEQMKFNCDTKDKYNILDDIKTQINEMKIKMNIKTNSNENENKNEKQNENQNENQNEPDSLALILPKINDNEKDTDTVSNTIINKQNENLSKLQKQIESNQSKIKMLSAKFTNEIDNEEMTHTSATKDDKDFTYLNEQIVEIKTNINALNNTMNDKITNNAQMLQNQLAMQYKAVLNALPVPDMHVNMHTNNETILENDINKTDEDNMESKSISFNNVISMESMCEFNPSSLYDEIADIKANINNKNNSYESKLSKLISNISDLSTQIQKIQNKKQDNENHSEKLKMCRKNIAEQSQQTTDFVEVNNHENSERYNTLFTKQQKVQQKIEADIKGVKRAINKFETKHESQIKTLYSTIAKTKQQSDVMSQQKDFHLTPTSTDQVNQMLRSHKEWISKNSNDISSIKQKYMLMNNCSKNNFKKESNDLEERLTVINLALDRKANKNDLNKITRSLHGKENGLNNYMHCSDNAYFSGKGWKCLSCDRPTQIKQYVEINKNSSLSTMSLSTRPRTAYVINRNQCIRSQYSVPTVLPKLNK
eukprot:98053_1